MSPISEPDLQKIIGISDTVSRHDERIKNLFQENEDILKRCDKLDENLSSLQGLTQNHSGKIDKIIDRFDSIDSWGQKIFDAFWKLALLVIGAYILYLLNLSN